MQHHRQLEADDCIRTCIAMIIGRPPAEVPNFYRDDEPGAWDRARDWLRLEGYGLVRVPMRPPTVQQAIGRLKANISTPVIFGANINETEHNGHCVVVTPERVHDPAYDESGVHCLGATHTDGEVWVMVVVPL